MRHTQAQATLKDWERRLDLLDELSREECFTLIPLVQKALSPRIDELLANRCTNPEVTQLTVVLAKLFARTEERRRPPRLEGGVKTKGRSEPEGGGRRPNQRSSGITMTA